MAAKKRPVGRPRTVMTNEAKAKIVKSVELGMWPERAAEMHGINGATMRSERKRDPVFATAIKEAESNAEKSVLSRMFRHMETQWTACAWMLERRWAERWRKRDGDDMARKVRSEPVKDQKDIHSLLMDMVSAAASGKITPKQLKDMAQSLGIASDISERADLEERIKKLEGNG